MYTSVTIEELLEAKEGEKIQFKEAKQRFDFGEASGPASQREEFRVGFVACYNYL